MGGKKQYKRRLTMKKLIIGILLVTALLFSGCAGLGMYGGLYTDVTLPVPAVGTFSGRYNKVGTASATSILGLVATGDASITAAARKAGITKIHHVDAETQSILGIITTYTIKVYGQ